MQNLLDCLEQIKPYENVADIPHTPGETLIHELSRLEPKLQMVAPAAQFVKYLGIGGEAIVILARNKQSKQESVYKIGFAEFSEKGLRDVDQYSENPNDFQIEYRNNLKKRFLRGAGIQEVLSKEPEVAKLCIIPGVPVGKIKSNIQKGCLFVVFFQ